ncbi:MAG: ribosome biogenesis GTPase Der [Acidimicrobiia bacterium]|nr:ribosome biogenesis GTPase Der [Acidimicrobiia bacterium]MDX2466278.1 ribosome biogenesis GTPase Der [Acidimicrobiia bacterium]
MSRLPVVTVLGRPNVGKSTLVNRILQRKAAVVDEQPGVTRDRREFTAEWQGNRFLLIDTGGWELSPDAELTMNIREQAEVAVGGADLVVFVADATSDVVDDDQGVARLLLRSGVPFIFVANKVDGPRHEEQLDEMWSLGLGAPMPVSAQHGRGTGDFLDALVDKLPILEGEEESPGMARLAIIGRPNVGKSTLLNQLAGDDRVLVSEVPGTTRDPINLLVELDGELFEIIDTAGIKRATKIKDDVEYYATLRAREVLKKADVVLFIVDGTRGATHQEQRLAEEIRDAGVGLIVLLNKWDIVSDEERLETEDSVADRLGFVAWAPVLRMAAKTGSRLHRLPAAVRAVLDNRRRRIPTPELNRLIRQWQELHPPPVKKNKRPRIIYAVQTSTEPPNIVLFIRGGDIGVDYLRYLENRLREQYDFMGTPIRLTARRRHQRREQ